ncbi:hypothetical protein M758_3G052900 [Ceratodon purpureus]|nr:hypothetical protein M758_3G052900 [Ceratodon purpureus]
MCVPWRRAPADERSCDTIRAEAVALCKGSRDWIMATSPAPGLRDSMKNDLGEEKLEDGAEDRGAAALAAAPISPAAPWLPQNRPAALAVFTNDLAMCRLTPAIAYSSNSTKNCPKRNTNCSRFRKTGLSSSKI